MPFLEIGERYAGSGSAQRIHTLDPKAKISRLPTPVLGNRAVKFV
jgi:hypothetical protein